jgi:ParB/RepB/Spo0J family partition protein
MLFQYISIDNINVADDSFRMTFLPDLEALKVSIRSIGVVSPIHLRHTADGRYQIISGYKRVLASKELGKQTVPALIYEHVDISPIHSFLHNLHDNVFSRKLNLIEKAIVVSKLSRIYGVPEEELVERYLPLMGEGKSYKILHQLTSLVEVIEPVKIYIVRSELPLSSAARIAEFSPSAQNALLTILESVKPSAGKLNELLDLIREISARDGISVEDVLVRYELIAIVANPLTAPQDKIRALRQTLKGIRLPRLMEKQTEFLKLIQELELPEGADLKVDPYFEDPSMKLEYKFDAPEELELLVAHLGEAIKKQQWKKIFEWYRA